jgi:hypothetical protein
MLVSEMVKTGFRSGLKLSTSEVKIPFVSTSEKEVCARRDQSWGKFNLKFGECYPALPVPM